MAYSGEGFLIEGQILGDPNKTVIPIVVDAQGRLIVDLTSSSFTIGDVVITDDSGNKAKVDSEGDVQVDVNNFPNQSTNANVTAVTVTTSSTVLIGPNINRKGLIFQSKDTDVYYILGSTPATTSVYSYFILKLNTLELEDFYGTVSAVVSTGTASVQVTEKI